MRFRRETPSIESWTIANLGAFFAQHRSELRDHAFRLLRNPSLADEVVQDSIVKVLLAAPELQSKEHALSYMHRTIRNLCMDQFRAEGRQPRLVLLDDAYVEVELKTASTAQADELLMAAEDAAIVREALSLLSPAERAALIMWELEGRSSSEIARELGIKESSVRHTVSRARTSLRKALSQVVVDEARGLTALDMLSKSYRKAQALVRDSQKLALSIVLIISGILSFSSIYGTTNMTSQVQTSLESNQEDYGFERSAQKASQTVSPSTGNLGEESEVDSKESPSRKTEIKSNELTFPGLDESGVPKGFSISDDSGSLGEAYFREKSLTIGEADLKEGQVLKTTTGAANIFLSQSLVSDSRGFEYRPNLAFGQAGMWVPLQIRVDSTEIKRSLNGNYIVTAYIAVESAVDSPIKVVANAGGRDLAQAPKRVITRLLLDSSKTQVLSQVVYVVEKEVES